MIPHPQVLRLQAKHSIRAAMDPAYDAESAFDGYLRGLLSGADPDTEPLPVPDRVQVAVTALSSRVNSAHHPAAPAPVIWHRWMAGTALVVRASSTGADQ